jgi:hypothetical protein
MAGDQAPRGRVPTVGKKPARRSVRGSRSEESPSGSDRDDEHRSDGRGMRSAARPPSCDMLLCRSPLPVRAVGGGTFGAAGPVVLCCKRKAAPKDGPGSNRTTAGINASAVVRFSPDQLPVPSSSPSDRSGSAVSGGCPSRRVANCSANSSTMIAMAVSPNAGGEPMGGWGRPMRPAAAGFADRAR